MVFSSIPAYLDPANWQQQQHPQHNNHHLQTTVGAITQLPPQQPPPHPHGSSTSGGIRPGSMADRARLANIALPETALKCPRCDSSNTKFCYFNNYSLSQPRHFCKTCRRYWTRGGSLRNVPVGGGCRRNKRSKGGSSSKSPASSGDRQPALSSSSTMSSSGTTDILGGLRSSQVQALRFMLPSFGHLTELAATSTHGHGDIGLNYNTFSTPISHLNFQTATSHVLPQTGGGGGGHVGVSESILSSSIGGGGGGGGGLEQWRLHQFPYLGGGFDSNMGLYPFGGGHAAEASGGYGGIMQMQPRVSSGLLGVSNNSELAGEVKMERNHHDHDQEKLLLGSVTRESSATATASDQHQYWSGNHHDQHNNINITTTSWMDISSFNSSASHNN